MYRIARIVLIGLAATLVALPAFAQENGFGVGAGISSTNYSEPGLTLNPAGIALTADYQIKLDGPLTVNPFFLFAHEQGEDVIFLGQTFSTEFDYSVLGLEARFWPTEQFFIGGHLANHNVTLTVTHVASGSSSSSSDSAAGFGLVGGAQFNQISILGLYDAYSINGSDFSSLRLLVVYRFPAT